MPRSWKLVLLALAVPAGAALPGAANREAPGIRLAVEKALPVIRRGAAGHTRQRGCFSCHHQAMPLLALTTARDHGFAVDPEDIRTQVSFTSTSLAGGRDAYRQGKGQGGGVGTATYALLALELGGAAPDESTEAVTGYVLARDADTGEWRISSNRPPSESTSFTSTALALRALRRWGTEDQKARVAARVEKAREWLLETPARETEERVFRLWGLTYAGADPAEVRAAAKQLRESQREDGGWGQLDGMTSDAYATGSALVALHDAARVEPGDPAYRRGVEFLLRMQEPDGTWRVRSRSKPFQPYYESGFPYGPDQFISMSATCWAVTALALACETP